MSAEPLQVKENLRVSFLDGIFANCMMGFTQDYVVPFLLLLGGTIRHVGLLNALPNLAASFIQLVSADLTEKLKSRKKMVTMFVFAQGIMLLPLVAIATDFELAVIF